jgi:putative ABC transport system permease protein
MSTMLEDRLAPPRARSGGVPARRAVVRWALRLFRREWRQQLLVLGLIIVAVAATILGAAIGTNTPPPANAGFGTANHSVTLPGSDPHLASDIAAISARFGPVDVIENKNISTGLAQVAQIRAQNPAGAYGKPMLSLVSGHYPAAPGEVAMTSQLASTFGLHVGDVWHYAGHALRVTGIVQNPQSLLDNFALVAPGQLTAGQLGPPGQVTVLFDGTASGVAAFRFPGGVTAQTPQASNGISPAIVVGVFAIFGLIFVGLVSVAGFTVLAQRRMRALGMLSSLGATDRNIRLVMVANGAVVGLVGALIGAVIGFAAWIAYAPHLASSAHHVVAWTSLPWWLIGAAMALAVVTATLASRRPAKAIARVPVMTALAGRPAPPKAAHRSAVPGVILLVVGPVLLAFSGGWGGNGGRDTLFQLGGLLAAAIGLLLVAPACLTLTAGLARRVPVAERLALRDLARYRARSGSALAAVSLAVFVAMLVILLASGRYADPVDYFAPNLPSNQLIVYTPGSSPVGGGPNATGPQQSQARMQATANAIAASLGSHDVLPLETVGIGLTQITSQGGQGGPGNIYVATPALLSHYGINPDAIDPTTLLITSRPGLEGTPDLQLGGGPGPGGSGGGVMNPKIQTFGNLPTDASDPNLLVTEYAVRTHHLQVTPAGWLIQTPQPLSAAQISAARATASAAALTIETKNEDPSLSELRNYSTAAGIIVALGVLAMTVGLIRSETARDLRTLTATGASARTRRAITGTTAGAIGLLGAVLGTAVAYLTVGAYFRSQLGERMSQVPVLDLILILVGLPVVAAIGGWLLAGREPREIAHQPIE